MCKCNKDFLQVKKLDSLRQPSQSPDLNSSVRDECRMTQKQATNGCRKGLAENLKGANTTFSNIWCVLGSQVFSFSSIKNIFKFMSACPISFEPEIGKVCIKLTAILKQFVHKSCKTP